MGQVVSRMGFCAKLESKLTELHVEVENRLSELSHVQNLIEKSFMQYWWI